MHRRLCAILAADVVGYARALREDEAATLDALRGLRVGVLAPALNDHNGTLLKSMGDGWLIAFPSSEDAVTAAMRIQDATEICALRLRMGVHIGDVTTEAEDIYGDGINIAARLESAAPPGGLLISEVVYANLDGTRTPSFSPAGARALKNIDHPVTCWLRGRAHPLSEPATPSPWRAFAPRNPLAEPVRRHDLDPQIRHHPRRQFRLARQHHERDRWPRHGFAA